MKVGDTSGLGDSSAVMRALLEDQQLRNREQKQIRDVSHELGRGMLRIESIYDRLTQAEEKLEKYTQWVNVAMSVVSIAGSARGVHSEVKAMKSPSSASPPKPKSEEKMSPLDWGMKVIEVGLSVLGGIAAERTERATNAKERAGRVGEQAFDNYASAVDGAAKDRELTRKLIDAMRSRDQKHEEKTNQT